MLTQAPLFKWNALLRSFFSTKPDMDMLGQHWVKNGEVAGWFSKSAWSLAKIAHWRLVQNGKSCSVWVPDYFCNSSLLPLRAMGIELIFYPVTNEMTPDYKACRQLAKEQKMDLFIITHYMGKPAPVAPAKEICSQNNAWLIEDAAHVLKRVKDIGKYGDFILFSPHKLIAIPDGALLIICPKGPAQFGKNLMNLFGDADKWAEKLAYKSENRVSVVYFPKLYVLIWILKRTLQKIGIRSNKEPKVFFEAFPESNAINSTRMIPPTMTLFSAKLLAAQIGDLSKIARLRNRNLIHWQGILANLKISHKVKVESNNDGRWVPYLAAFKLDASNTEKQFMEYRNLSLPVMTWPDLPPEVLTGGDNHEVAYSLRHSYVFLPIHHTIKDSDLFRLVRNLVQSDKKLQVKVNWDCSSRSEWADYLRQSGRSNLLQSWEYGEAKKTIENWNVKRGIFSIDGQEVAIVQVLEKNIFGLLKIYRINRGPLFLKNIDQATIYSVFSLLHDELKGFLKNRVLFHAPELNIAGNSIMLLSKLGYRLTNSKAWESIWVDLGQTQEELRTQLDGKWRNQLVLAEKNNLSNKVYTNTDSFEWILNQCNEMMCSRKVGKIPVELYRYVKKYLDETNQPIIIFKAFSGEELIAGIGIIFHGNAATYLLGWNDEKGRQLNANQYLLWNAMLYMKERGINWFDLGGIDEESVPGITDFKLGLNGMKYNIVGEYLSI